MQTTCSPKEKSERLLDRNELKIRWSVSVPTIQRLEKRGVLQPVRLPGGRLVRYRESDLIRIETAQSLKVVS